MNTPAKPVEADTSPEAEDVPVMPFNEALKRVWSAPAAPKIKPKEEEKPAEAGSKGVTPSI